MSPIRIPIVDRYLVREVLFAWLAVLLVLFAVLATNRLIRYLGDAAGGELPAGVILTLLGLQTVRYLGLILPASFFLGIVLAFGRLYRDSEMAVMSACGIGPWRQFRALLWLAVPLAALVGMLSLYWGPAAAHKAEVVQAEAEADMEFAALQAGRFLQARGATEGTLYLEGLSEDQREMEDVFIRSQNNDDRVILAARRGIQEEDPITGDRYLVLLDGWRYDGEPDRADWRVTRFQRHGVLVEERPEDIDIRARRNAQPLAELWGSDTAADRAEVQWRLAMPVMTLLLALLAVPLSKSAPRDGRYGRLLSAVLVYVGYFQLLTVGQDWLEGGQVPAALGLWWLHGGVLLAGVVGLLWRFDLLPSRGGRQGAAS